jgi:hypothetical protein
MVKLAADPRARAAALAGVPLSHAQLIEGATDDDLVEDAGRLRLEMQARGLPVVEPLAALIARTGAAP